MLERISQHWWVLLVRGIIALLLGLVAIALPGVTALALALLFAAYALIDGIASIVASVRMPHDGSRWVWLLLGGIIGVLFGIAALIFPAISLLYLVFMIAAWAIITGILEIATAWRLRETIKGEWLWIIAGVLSLVFGIAVLFEPTAGVLVIVYIFAFYAILTGVTFLGLAFRLRKPKIATT